MPVTKNHTGIVEDADLVRTTIVYAKPRGSSVYQWSVTQTYMVGDEEKTLSLEITTPINNSLEAMMNSLKAKAKQQIEAALGL